MTPRELLSNQFKDDSLTCPLEPRDEGASANDRGRLLLPSTLCYQQRYCNRRRLARFERHFFEFFFVAIAHTITEVGAVHKHSVYAEKERAPLEPSISA